MKKYRIHSVVGGIYTLFSIEENLEIKLPAAGKLRFLKQTPIVGDFVNVSDNLITEILPRKNEFIRPKVANIDQMFIFMSIKEPEFQPYLVDKYLAIIEQKAIKPFICLTKVDLDSQKTQEIYQLYSKMGYQVFLLNNTKPEYQKEITPYFKNMYSVFMGQSGVGKTTTLNYLADHKFETQAISKALGRGKHTTRVVKAISFNAGYLIDTPGFSSLELNMNKIELAQSFESFKNLAKTCKFRSCLHLEEPEKFCAVKQQIGTSLIPDFRYQNYVKLQSELDK
ncbi:ribosome small subunit-dependent GTPase A [Mycoplasma buteonis]|uniref:ribosome small subunit-dependent GTPase A n=1 Tax=Mycoplasma buteonis TaxID=171280 RepID=UPI000562819A|nr:ribosome small subunit-dependent GTPase A [Mycoplasma buteonis]